MSDIIDINVAQTVEEVTINVTEEVIQVNINTINGGGGIESVVAGTNITVDNTDPLNPIINANADAVTSVNSDTGAVIVDLQSATDEGNETTNPIKVAELFLYDSANSFYNKITTSDGIFNFILDDGTVVASFDSGGGFTFVNASGFKSTDVNSSLTANRTHQKINESGDSVLTVIKTSSFTAVNSAVYTANGTLTVTDPTPLANKGFIVHVIGGTSTIGGVGYTTGALVYRYYDGSSWISTNMNGSTDAVLKSDYTPAHSILVQQSGTGTPTALSVGNNTLVGRLSGGGSDINDLSVSDVRTLLSIDTDLATKADKSRVEQVLRSKNNGTYGTHTGNTANTVIETIAITGGEFVIGDWMNFVFDFTKVGTAGSATIRFYAGTLGTTSDPLIAALFMNTNVLDAGFSRERFQFKTGNILSGLANNYTAQVFDMVANTVAKTQTSLTPSADWNLTIAVQLANAGDTVSCEGYVISKINSF
jgi:hypothetical protein